MYVRMYVGISSEPRGCDRRAVCGRLIVSTNRRGAVVVVVVLMEVGVVVGSDERQGDNGCGSRCRSREMTGLQSDVGEVGSSVRIAEARRRAWERLWFRHTTSVVQVTGLSTVVKCAERLSEYSTKYLRSVGFSRCEMSEM